jgi:phage protein U
MQKAIIGIARAEEKARNLANIVARTDADEARGDTDLRNLHESLLFRERGAESEAQRAIEAMSAAAVRIADGAHDGRGTARAIDAAINGIGHIGTLADEISNGVKSIAGSNRVTEIRQIGSLLQNAGAVMGDSIENVSRIFQGQPGAPLDWPLLREIPVSSTAATRDSLAAGAESSFPDAMHSQGHLMILTGASGQFYFNISTAGYDSLRRMTAYNIAEQDRLTRRPALQAVSKGSESLTISGAIFTKQSGARQLNKLREIGFAMEPVVLTTGYGENYGQWYIERIEEEQAYLFPDGMPRKQTFTIELQRYGEDYLRV